MGLYTRQNKQQKQKTIHRKNHLHSLAALRPLQTLKTMVSSKGKSLKKNMQRKNKKRWKECGKI